MNVKSALQSTLPVTVYKEKCSCVAHCECFLPLCLPVELLLIIAAVNLNQEKKKKLMNATDEQGKKQTPNVMPAGIKYFLFVLLFIYL